MIFRLTAAVFVFLVAADAVAQAPSPAAFAEWQSRKYGMFIHFGLYSILGGEWNGKQYSGNYSEQIQSDAHIPEADYAKLAAQFNPVKWDPDAIVQLAEDAGMKFIVLTSKHHDGFSLFHTQASSYNAVDATPYGRDVVKSLSDACARRHMPFGVYYSTIDWHFGDVPHRSNDNPISEVHENFNVAQLRELMSGYGPISEIWFDMGHPTKLQSRHFADTVHALQPDCLVSGRVWNNQGDFMEMGDDAIPEYVLDEPWESPASIYADTWGYRSWEKRTDLPGKIHEHLLRLVKVVSGGGNYILNIGPRGDGSVVEFEADVLRGVGAWLLQNGEAIYGTQAQPFRKLDFGSATVKDNRLFLFIEHLPSSGRLELPGLQNRIQTASLLSDKAHQSLQIDNRTDHKGVLLSRVDQRRLQVVAVELDGSPQILQPAIQPLSDKSIQLPAASADHFYNSNGEGYDDIATLRKLEWHFAISQPGVYRVKVVYKLGKFSRLLDVVVAGTTLKANLHGDEKGPAMIGTVELPATRDAVLVVTRAAPAERDAVLDVALDSISLSPAPR